MNLDEQDGQTPLDPDEKAGLIPRHIDTQGALNDWEQENILAASLWLRKVKVSEVLEEDFCRQLHKRMFGKTWKWAGTFRTSDKNIGCDWRHVGTRLHQVLENTKYWAEKGVFAPDESVTRFHHALVLIHPFPNGNGRHSRLMADRLLLQLGQQPFSWGSGGDLVGKSETRASYLAALRSADKGDFGPLLGFVRT
ncbi:MAG: mobile mystery protein B [Burkholderiaceae bacterium]|nr:mobile mystery protein B [Burkholderiaceae bacterium]